MDRADRAGGAVMKVRLLYDRSLIQERVQHLGDRVERDHATADPLVVSLLGGSVIFLSDLIRAISRPIRFDFIQVHYSANALNDNILEIQYPISLNVTGQHLVILKDVTGPGVIETYLASQFLEHGARRVRFATLIDIPGERKTEFKPDYSVFLAKRTGRFVGYGLKFRSRYGNLPYIGVLSDNDDEEEESPRAEESGERGRAAGIQPPGEPF